MRNKSITIGLLVVASMVLGACAQATPQTIVERETIVETVPVEVTRMVAGTPQVETIIITTTPPAMTPDDVEGTILVDGSSTVAPITAALAEEFQTEYRNVRVPVGISGTGGGFKKFCRGETDISDASRPIKQSEIDECAQNDIEYVELPVAFDGLAVVVHRENDWAVCLTVNELKTIWSPESENIVMNWNQVRDGFPDLPLGLYAPGADSGTFDYFTEAINGAGGVSRPDFLPSEDDNVLVQGVSGDQGGLAYFGLAYYEQNPGILKLVAIDGGNGCVEPNAETVAGGTYQPLSRPLFIYVNRDRIDQKDEISAFVAYYLANAKMLVTEVGYIPLTDEIYSLAQQRFDRRVTGSMFAGGPQVGVSLAELLEKTQE